LTPGAKFSLIDGVIGIALEFDRAAFAGSDVQTAGRWTFGARRGVPNRDTGRDGLGLLHIRDQLFHRLGAGRCGCTRAHTHQFQEIATIEFGHFYFRFSISYSVRQPEPLQTPPASAVIESLNRNRIPASASSLASDGKLLK
jgi:hypothetical protein